MHGDLAQRIAAGCAVVTPNRRLAAHLTRAYDARQAAAGKSAWPTADILPFAAFVERAYRDALYSAEAAALPVLLAPAQEQALWESVIRDSDAGDALLAIPETAAVAREAWRLAHAWRLTARIGAFALNDDGKAFRQWAQRYEAVTRRARQTDRARLTDVTATLIARPGIRKPRSLVHYGFDVLMPQQSALFEALAAAGCEVTGAGPEPGGGESMRLACADSVEEIRRAAAWARARLEANRAARIGIIVPELARHRAAIRRIFSAVVEPAYALPGARHDTLPFNISHGEPLASYPLVHAAFLGLELAGREIDFERASRLVRSPFIAGGDSEAARRARLDAWLRKRAEPAVTLERLIALIARADAGCPVLAQRLAALAEFRKARLFGGQPPSAWARAIAEALALIGFPGNAASTRRNSRRSRNGTRRLPTSRRSTAFFRARDTPTRCRGCGAWRRTSSSSRRHPTCRSRCWASSKRPACSSTTSGSWGFPTTPGRARPIPIRSCRSSRSAMPVFRRHLPPACSSSRGV